MSLETRAGVTLGEASRLWAKVAMLSFGGPAAQIGVMHRLLVEERRWISPSRFQHALNFCMLLPGPEAMQLATYSGWLLNGPIGGLIAGGLFILPGVVALMALSMLYAVQGHVGAVAAIFFGLKAAVLSIVVEAVLRLAKRSLRNSASRVVAAAAFVAIFFFAAPFPAVVIGAGLLGYVAAVMRWPAFAAAKPAAGQDEAEVGLARQSFRATMVAAGIALVAWLAPVALLVAGLGSNNVFARIAVFFSQTAVVTFGGAYSVLAYVAQQAVANHGWLAPGEMLDGLSLAETTPGPLIMVLQFVGFLAAYRAPGGLSPLWAGALGGLIATWTTFAPCFFWIFLGAPFVEKIRGVAALTGALSAIGAAVVGAILNLAIWFAVHAMFARVVPVRAWGLAFDAPVWGSANVAAIGLAALGALMVFRWHLGMGRTFAISAAAGVGLWALGWAGQ